MSLIYRGLAYNQDVSVSQQLQADRSIRPQGAIALIY